MTFNLSKDEFRLLKKFISERSGINITDDKAYLIECRLSRLVSESGLKNFYGLYRALESNSRLTQMVIDAITINETQWFRDKSPWMVLENVFLPVYIDEIRKGKRSEVKIWSAACSSGQEPYSIAICIKKYLDKYSITDIHMSNFKIVATDISESVLETARAGRYDRISVERGLDTDTLNDFFDKVGSYWFVNNGIKKMVEFRRSNLAGLSSPAEKYDIIFCRYVMIYFSEELKDILIKKIASALKPGGVMFLGNSEILYEDSSFEKLSCKDGIYYRVRR